MLNLDQTFKDKTGKTISLKDVLTQDDWWEMKKRNKKTIIITHAGMKKIADVAGVDKVVDYQVLIQPSYANNYQQTWVATIRRGNEVVNEVGEVNNSNLTNTTKRNPSNMAQKRAYDRAVIRLLGIEGVLSEDELTPDEDDKMQQLTVEQQKKVAPIVTKLLNVKDKASLDLVAKTIKSTVNKYTEDELNYLRKLYNKRLIEISKSKF